MELRPIHGQNIDELLPQCLELQQYLVHDATTIDARKFIATASAPESYFLGLFEEERLVGVGVLSKVTHPVNVTGFINNIVVHPDVRGRGYFTVIMDALEAKARDWNCTEVALTCSRPEVQGRYEKRGYQQKDTRYYTFKLQ